MLREHLRENEIKRSALRWVRLTDVRRYLLVFRRCLGQLLFRHVQEAVPKVVRADVVKRESGIGTPADFANGTAAIRCKQGLERGLEIGEGVLRLAEPNHRARCCASRGGTGHRVTTTMMATVFACIRTVARRRRGTFIAPTALTPASHSARNAESPPGAQPVPAPTGRSLR